VSAMGIALAPAWVRLLASTANAARAASVSNRVFTHDEALI
jgi:hypothetical protein